MNKNRPSIVKVGDHWGSADADWVKNKTEPPMSPAVPVAVDGSKDYKVAEEVKDAPTPAVPRAGIGTNPGTTVN